MTSVAQVCLPRASNGDLGGRTRTRTRTRRGASSLLLSFPRRKQQQRVVLCSKNEDHSAPVPPEDPIEGLKRMLGTSLHKTAKKLVSSLEKKERDEIIAVLLSASDGSIEKDPKLATLQKETTITRKEMLLLIVKSAIGMLGFGFVDNAIMIIAGDAIESSIGATFGLSTMAAAGLGNAVSDFFGIILCGYIERASEKFMPDMNLTPMQLQSSKAQLAETIGGSTGVTLGCVLGLAPLLFMSSEEGGSGGSTSNRNNRDDDDDVASIGYRSDGRSRSTIRETTFASMSSAIQLIKPRVHQRHFSIPVLLSVSLFVVMKRLVK